MKNLKQPLIIDDNAASDDDRLSIEAIRNIYIDPEEVDGTAVPLAENQITGERQQHGHQMVSLCHMLQGVQFLSSLPLTVRFLIPKY